MAGINRVLVVDDDASVLNFLRSAMRTLGFEVEAFTSPQEALQRLESGNFSAILLDFQMEGMNGIELARAVRALPAYADCPIVLLTAYPNPEVVQQCLMAGVNFFLPKPVSVHQLQELLDPNHGMLAEQNRRTSEGRLKLPATCAWQGLRIEGQLLGLNSAGARMLLTEVPPPGSSVTVSFRIPGQVRPIEIIGEVIGATLRTDGRQPLMEVAVRFTVLPGEAEAEGETEGDLLTNGGTDPGLAC